jgi:Piezo non-specific cation channel, R-Ras-binding domain
MVSWLGFQVWLWKHIRYHIRLANVQRGKVKRVMQKPRHICCHVLQIFAAVPFVYELREILDWSATATTLRLYDWLKLEVGWSTDRLHLAACRRQS